MGGCSSLRPPTSPAAAATAHRPGGRHRVALTIRGVGASPTASGAVFVETALGETFRLDWLPSNPVYSFDTTPLASVVGAAADIELEIPRSLAGVDWERN